jgi:hypothetical protein
MANLAFQRFHTCFVLVQNDKPPSDDEWALWLKFLVQARSLSASAVRVLVVSAGGSPTAKQRAEIHKLTPKSGEGVTTAVVIPSFVGRTVVGAMALFNNNVRPFSPKATRDALNYLGISPELHGEVMALVHALQQKVNASVQIELN